MKAEAAKGANSARPFGPAAAPASTNQVIGQANLTSQGAPGPSLFPPDTHAAPGLTEFVTVTNSKISMYTKSPGAPALLSELSLATFFGYAAETIFDPQVQYDTRWDRFVVLAEADVEPDGDQFLFIAISNDSTMTGPYIVRTINVGGFSTFLDYPKMSLTQDAVVISFNDFAPGFVDGNILGIAKALLYTGKGFSVPVFGGFTGTVTPPNVIDQNPRAHALEFTPGVGARNVEFRNPQTGAYSAIASVSAIAGESFAVPADALQPAAPACTAPSCNLDTIDGRFQDEPTQYGDDLWAVHAVGSPATPRWYDFDTEGAGANTIKQSSFVQVSATSHDFNPAIAAQSDGRAYISWSYTDPSDPCATGCPSMAFTGRLGADPINTENPPTIVHNSAIKMMSNYSPSKGLQRWGDYSSIRFDPSIFDRAYLYNERVPASGWGTRQAAVRVIP